MESCSVHLWVLSFLVLVPVSPLELSSQTAKLHHPVTLPCKQKCSGVVKWTMISKPGQVVAQCDPTSCQSKKEGFKISHDQYLDGDLDLGISSVDYSHRTVFICECDGKIVCNIRLHVEATTSTVQKKLGEVLLMDFPKLDMVEVEFRSKNTTQLYGDQICAEIYDVLQCRSDYTQRTSFSNRTLALRDLEVSDSGVYIVQDMKNEQVIHSYVLSVEDPNQQPPEGQVSTGTIVAAVLIPLLVLFGLLLGFIYMRRREKKKLDEIIKQQRRENEEQTKLIEQQKGENEEQTKLIEQQRREKEELEREKKLQEDELQAIETAEAEELTSSYRKQRMLLLINHVDEVMRTYGTSQNRSSTRNLTVVKLLRNTIAETDDFLKTWIVDEPKYKLVVLWKDQKAELEETIKKRMRENPESKDQTVGRATELQTFETEEARRMMRSYRNMRKSLLTNLVDKVMRKYGNKEGKGFQNWSLRNQAVDDLLGDTRAEIEAFTKRWKGEPESNDTRTEMFDFMEIWPSDWQGNIQMKLCCEKKKVELDEIIHRRRRKRTELDKNMKEPQSSGIESQGKNEEAESAELVELVEMVKQNERSEAFSRASGRRSAGDDV